MKFKGLAKCIPRDRDAIFLPYQSKWIKDTSRLKLGEKARQLGWTWSAAYAADEAARIRGRRSDEIETLLGYRGASVLIHRDDMVLDDR